MWKAESKEKGYICL